MSINKVTVLGAGAMGSQIAAHLVNVGLKVQLLDIVVDEDDPNKLAKEAKGRITHRKKGLLYDNDLAGNLSIGNFNDDLKEANDSDLYIEAVSEKLEIKHDVWGKVAKVAKDSAILATNTSGIPIADIAEPFEEGFQKRFLGLHFFNPVRIMKLVEIIKHKGTDEEVVEDLANFTTYTLGKGVVICHDVTGFVGNRIGTFTGMDIAYRAEQEGLAVNETDALSGQVLGRPRMGTNRLSDFVGIDIGYHGSHGLKDDPEEAEYFNLPEASEYLYEKGWLGDKSGQGFYQKQEDGSKLIFDLEKKDYVEPKEVNFDILKDLGKDLKHNFNTIFEAEDEIGLFLWKTLRNLFFYSAVNVGKATDEYKNIDRAMVWGYNWKVGPFQAWDLIGVERVAKRIEDEIDDIPGNDTELPEWVKGRTEPFYKEGESISNVPEVESFYHENIWTNEGTSRLDTTEDGVLLLQMLTPNNTLTVDFQKDIEKAIDVLEEEDYKGLVLHTPGPHFSYGANLNDMKDAIDRGVVDTETREGTEGLHHAVSRMKYAAKPVVSAVSGRALGGGAELLLHSTHVVAAAESYIGLVEAGVGLIPGGAGTVELAERIYRAGYTKPETIKHLSNLLSNVATGSVSKHAYDARKKGFLRDTDQIVQNEELVVAAAIDKVRAESKYNYIPQHKANYSVLGTDFIALAHSNLDSQRDGNFASDYDVFVGTKLAEVIAGGNVPVHTVVNEDQLLQVEVDNFVKLSQEEKTYDRITYMLENNKPLRN